MGKIIKHFFELVWGIILLLYSIFIEVPFMWIKKGKDRGFWIVFTIYILALITDIVTTMMVGEAKSVLETNPLYNFLGLGFFPIILLNGAITWLLWWLYSRPNSSPTARFFLIMAMLMIISVRIYAVHNAMVYINESITTQEAQVMVEQNPTLKLETTKQVVYLAYPPFIFALIGFIFWRLDHNARRKDN